MKVEKSAKNGQMVQNCYPLSPDVVLHKVPDELGDIGRGIYKYKMVEGAFVLKDDLGDWEDKNKRAIINSYRSQRNELLAQTDWTQTDDCPLDFDMKEKYRAYRRNRYPARDVYLRQREYCVESVV